MLHYLVLAVISMATLAWCRDGHASHGGNAAQEPTCYSRFDYEHKVLMKIVELETEQSQLHEVIKQQKDTITTLQTQLTEHGHQQDALHESVTHLQSMSSVGSGATYVRWGRSTCPENGTELVYEGYAGGSHYTESGAPAEYLCLPRDPMWGYFQDGYQGGSTVRGVEYEFDDIDRAAMFGLEIRDQDAPCAVCRTRRPTTIMLPARNQCHDGWTLEYAGYLSGGHYSHSAASQFVCLDGEPESIVGGTGSDNGKLLYPAEAYCGSLRCPPYIAGRELTCAVCSK